MFNFLKRTPKPECDHQFERGTLSKRRFLLLGRGWVEDLSNPKFPKSVLRCTKCEGITFYKEDMLC